MKPIVIGKLVLCFDMDFDMNAISEYIGLSPSSSQRMSETRINPITKKHNCGFWTIDTNALETYDSSEAQQALYEMTHPYIDKIAEALHAHKGESIYRFVIKTKENEFPALMFESAFLSDIYFLGAKLDIVITST